MLFKKANCFKVEWVVSPGDYLIAYIEQYEVAWFDSENSVCFEMERLIRRTTIALSESDEITHTDLHEWMLSIADSEEGLRRILSRLFARLGVMDIYLVNSMVENSITYLYNDSE